MSLNEGRKLPQLAGPSQRHAEVDDGPLVHLHHHGQGLGLVFGLHAFLKISKNKNWQSSLKLTTSYFKKARAHTTTRLGLQLLLFSLQGNAY